MRNYSKMNDLPQQLVPKVGSFRTLIENPAFSITYAEFIRVPRHLHERTAETFIIYEGVGKLKKYPALEKKNKDERNLKYEIPLSVQPEEIKLHHGVSVNIEPFIPHSIDVLTTVLLAYLVNVPAFDTLDEFPVEVTSTKM